MRGEFYIPVPTYVADAIEIWESMRPLNQDLLEDRKTHKPTKYLFQYRNELMSPKFLNDSAIPLLCKIAGVSQTDVVGRITSHRARATTAIWMRKMGMAPTDIGKLLGHTNQQNRSLGIFVRISIIWGVPTEKRIRLIVMWQPFSILVRRPGKNHVFSTILQMGLRGALGCVGILISLDAFIR